MRARVALATGLALMAIAIVLTLSGSPQQLVGTDSASRHIEFATLHGSTGVCQPDEVLPRGTSAIRLSVDAVIGPAVQLTARSGGQILTYGTRGSGWTSSAVTIHVPHVQRTAQDVTLCLAFGHSREGVKLLGQPSPLETAASNEGTDLGGRIRTEYLAAGHRSWWSLALSVARRIGLGRAPSGTWVALLALALMAVVAILACGLCIHELGATARRVRQGSRPSARLARARWAIGQVPVAAWVCALLACLNAACWSILSPPFQVPDEPSHFAYVQQLAEAHRLPVEGTEFSPEEETAMRDLRQGSVQFTPGLETISSRKQQQQLEHDLRQPFARRGPGEAGFAANEPPLYYTLETIPYYLGSGGTLLDRLELMRLLSAVFAGIAALFAFLFIREALPGAPWAWTVGGLGAALTPMFGFISGAVNPESMLIAVTAALFYLLARAFHRGLTLRLTLAIAAAVATGVLTKLNFLGLVPGAAIGLLVVAHRASPEFRRNARTALAIGVGALAIYIVLGSLVGHSSFKLISTSAYVATKTGSVTSEISYVWQFYLPRLPGMTSYFPGIFTLRQLWFDGLIGLYGWSDTVFPGWVYDLALIPAAIIALLCLRALFTSRSSLRGRAAELIVYATMGVGLMVVIGAFSFRGDILDHNGAYWEPRYLVPLLALFGAMLALAARGAGRRWGTAAGALIVVAILAHDVFSQLLVISRFYG